MRIRPILIGTAAAAATLVLAAGPASAGEVNGTGKPTQGPAHANSICVFSGLEDGTDVPPGAPSGPGTAQNWGQIPKEGRAFLTSIGENPGIACNGHLNPWTPGSEGP